jgi:hypothetical protein
LPRGLGSEASYNHYFMCSKKPKCLNTYKHVNELNILKWRWPRGVRIEASYNHYCTYSKKPKCLITYKHVNKLHILKWPRPRELITYILVCEFNPQMALVIRPQIRGLIHTLVYFFKNKQNASLHTSLSMNQTTSNGLGQETSDPRPHTITTLHTLRNPNASLHTYLFRN